jgi:hypothetical protein
MGMDPSPTSRAENTIKTECMQESDHRQSICSLVCALPHHPCPPKFGTYAKVFMTTFYWT